MYRIIALSVVLYGCETWSLTLREERMTVFEDRVLRRLFGSKRDQITREWRILGSGKVYHLSFSPNIARMMKSRRIRWVGNVAPTEK
jgi:hypothetical protein